MLARLGFMTRAYKARVGPLDTISTIPIRSFFTRKPDHRRSWVLQLSLGSGSASGKFVNERILTEGFELPEYRPNRPHPYPSEGRRVSSWSAPVHGKKTICHANRPSTACRLLQDSSYRSRCRLLAAKHLAMVSCGRGPSRGHREGAWDQNQCLAGGAADHREPFRGSDTNQPI